MTYILIAGGVVICLWILLAIYTAKKQQVFTATISIAETGETQVSFIPVAPDQKDLLHLVLSYGAKLRWVLYNEPEVICTAFRDFTEEAIASWQALNENERLIHRLPNSSVHMAKFILLSFAVPGGERFVVHFRRSSNGSGYVVNYFPRPGLAINLVWHFILLLDEVQARLDKQKNDSAKVALSEWWNLMYSDLGLDKSLKGLQILTTASDEIFARVVIGSG